MEDQEQKNILNQHQLYFKSSQAWEAMLQEIESAKTSIDFEQFLIWNDEISLLFYEALKKKANEGIKIRMLLDAVGSFAFYRSNIPNELKEAGIEVEFFNPFIPWYPTNRSLWYFRDHRRILTIDEKIAFIGGVCISNDMKDWRDTHMKLVGPVVEGIQKTFNQMWLIQKKPHDRLEYRMKSKEDIFKDEDGICYLNTSPLPGKRYLYKTLLKLLKLSQKEILITTPYFCPDAKLLKLLLKISRRGIKVKILLPRRSNHLIVDYGFQTYVPELLKNKIEIWYYEKGMIHAKTIVIDDEYCLVGSLNLDNISLKYNFEGNIIAKDHEMAKDLNQMWNEDLKNSTQLTKEEFIKRSLISKFYTLLVYPFRKLL